MDLDRRTLLLGFSALAIAGRAKAQKLKIVNPRQRAIASVWPALEAAPYIRSSKVAAGVITTCYMFTNKSCPRCQAFHREHPRGFSALDFRYIIMPWNADDQNELNFLFADRTEAAYLAYMRRQLKVPRTVRLSNRVPEMSALAARVGNTLIIGSMGTPYFLFRIFDASDNSVIYVAGDIADEGVRRLFQVSGG